jgi:hypothetical protein
MTVLVPPLQRARPLGALRYPRVPSEALRSMLRGQVIECRVAVAATGSASADCGGNRPEIPPFILLRAREMLERTPWQPAGTEHGDSLADQIIVKFIME